jgi:hypothetical protein
MNAIVRLFTRTRIMALVIAAAALFVPTMTPRAHAASDGAQVNGTFRYSGSLLVGCPAGALLCTHGSFSGGLSGSFTLTLLTTVPSVDPGVDYFTGWLAFRNGQGTFNCTLDGALDSVTTSEGEFGEICVMKNGTGAYAKVKGDLRMIGTSTSTLLIIPSGAGEFQGTITTS